MNLIRGKHIYCNKYQKFKIAEEIYGDVNTAI